MAIDEKLALERAHRSLATNDMDEQELIEVVKVAQVVAGLSIEIMDSMIRPKGCDISIIVDVSALLMATCLFSQDRQTCPYEEEGNGLLSDDDRISLLVVRIRSLVESMRSDPALVAAAAGIFKTGRAN